MEKRRNKSRINPNVIWVIVILSMIIVLLLSVILNCYVSDASEILRFLSYTSTILSILLSIFAILFTYFSSMQLDQKIAEIDNAVTEIKAVNNQLSTSNQTLVSTLVSMHEKIGNIEARQGGNKYEDNENGIAETGASNKI